MERITKKDLILVVAGAIAWPVLYFLFNFLAGSATLIGRFLSNSVYTTASNINAHSGNTITFIIFLILVSLFIMGILSTLSDYKNSAVAFKKYREEYLNLEEKSKEEERKYSKLENDYKKQKSGYRAMVSWFIILLIVFFGIAFVNTNANSHYDQFIKDSETIAPYISDQELKILKSKWRQMKQDEDHKKIVHYIDSTYTANNLSKPERNK